VTNIAVGAIGFFLGLAGHDIAQQALSNESPFHPLVGVCPRCGNHRGWDVLRCPQCDRVVAREPVVALATSAAAIGFFATIGSTWELIPYLGFLLLSTALIVTDLESFRIVDRLNIPGTILLALTLGLASLVTGHLDAMARGVAGAVSYLGGSSIVFIAVRGRGFGAGDVKLAAQLGLFTAYLSWGALGWAVIGTAAIGGVVAVVMLVGGGAGMKAELPYGPPMILGAWTAIVMVGVGAIPIPS
jgi:leader peptidase (prepilin peptidase)/N-methyltransferase